MRCISCDNFIENRAVNPHTETEDDMCNWCRRESQSNTLPHEYTHGGAREGLTPPTNDYYDN